jgi:hypothetical protein
VKPTQTFIGRQARTDRGDAAGDELRSHGLRWW